MPLGGTKEIIDLFEVLAGSVQNQLSVKTHPASTPAEHPAIISSIPRLIVGRFLPQWIPPTKKLVLKERKKERTNERTNERKKERKVYYIKKKKKQASSGTGLTPQP